MDGKIKVDPLDNYQEGLKDLNKARELDTENKLSDKIDEGFAYAEDFVELFNEFSPEEHRIVSEGEKANGNLVHRWIQSNTAIPV